MPAERTLFIAHSMLRVNVTRSRVRNRCVGYMLPCKTWALARYNDVYNGDEGGATTDEQRAIARDVHGTNTTRWHVK